MNAYKIKAKMKNDPINEIVAIGLKNNIILLSINYYIIVHSSFNLNEKSIRIDVPFEGNFVIFPFS